jgi:hypothetical protein
MEARIVTTEARTADVRVVISSRFSDGTPAGGSAFFADGKAFDWGCAGPNGKLHLYGSRRGNRAGVTLNSPKRLAQVAAALAAVPPPPPARFLVGDFLVVEERSNWMLYAICGLGKGTPTLEGIVAFASREEATEMALRETEDMHRATARG